MVFGRPTDELLQLNEATLWSGGPVGTASILAPMRPWARYARRSPAAITKLPTPWRARCRAGIRKASCRWATCTSARTCRDRKRAATGAAWTSATASPVPAFSAGGVHYRREVFASSPDQVIVVRLSADRPGQLNLELEAESQLRSSVTSAGNALVLQGKAPAHVDPNYVKYNAEPVVYEDSSGCKGMRFELVVQPQVTTARSKRPAGGSPSAAPRKWCCCCRRRPASMATINARTAPARTSMRWRARHLGAPPGVAMLPCATRTWPISARLFGRVSVDSTRPHRTKRHSHRRAPGRAYGRRAGPRARALVLPVRALPADRPLAHPATQPANLQGIWNDSTCARRGAANYTININTQMNYWPARRPTWPSATSRCST